MLLAKTLFLSIPVLHHQFYPQFNSRAILITFPPCMGPDLWNIVATEFLSSRIRKNFLKSSIWVQMGKEKKKKNLFNDINCLKTLLLLPIYKIVETEFII